MTVIYKAFPKIACKLTADAAEFVNNFFRDDDCFVFSADILEGRLRGSEAETRDPFAEIAEERRGCSKAGNRERG